MIEEELRSLLTERADAVPDNPIRSAEVRSRIGVLRRRRVAGAAFGLVLVVLAGLLVIRFPGSNESLPPGVPAPPYFDDIGRPAVPGYEFHSPWELDGPHEDLLTLPARDGFRSLIVARCERSGSVLVRNLAGPRFEVDCARRVGDGFEGATQLTPEQTQALAVSGPPALYPSGFNVAMEPRSQGRWLVAVLLANAPDRLPPHTDAGSRLLAEGTRTRAGTTVEITVPPARVPDAGERIEIAMGFVTECVAGVRLTFAVPTGGLGTADCDPLGKEMTSGRVGTDVTKQQLAALGLRPGDRVALTIRSVGRDTDQWRVFPPD